MMTPTSATLRRSLVALSCTGMLACGNGGGDSDADDDVGNTTANESGDGSSSNDQESGEQDGSSSAETTATSTADDTTADDTTADDTTATSTADDTTADDTTVDDTTADDTTADDTTADATDTDIADFCDKVDFLFVIDNSVSMLPEQDALNAAFPAFITAIEASLDTDDHILVADTDLIGKCSPANCANPMNLDPLCEGPDSYACTGDFEDCDITLGAGVVRPAGQSASNMFCDPAGGNRYLLETEPDKVGKFDCMAHVGLAGNGLERPVDAIVQAVSPGLNQAGGCNDAFLRDDAILVVTFISDDDHNNEVNSMQDAFDAIVAAKGGDLDRIVMLGLIPAPDNNCSGTPGAGEHWLQLIDMFGDQGLHGPSCDDDYLPFFQGAVDVIVQACQANAQ